MSSFPNETDFEADSTAAMTNDDKAEAARVVATATKDAEDRKRDQAKVSQGISKEDLQALMNAKMQKK